MIDPAFNSWSFHTLIPKCSVHITSVKSDHCTVDPDVVPFMYGFQAILKMVSTSEVGDQCLVVLDETRYLQIPLIVNSNESVPFNITH